VPHVGPPEAGTTWEGEDFARVDWDWTELERVTFLDCRFDRAALFVASWEDCKLTGSQFPGATLRPMTAVACDWSYASLRGVDLSGVVLWRRFDPTGVRLDLGQAVQFAGAHGALVEG
jgi:uncharacterized protein YjbI with pentapeptide repeats